MKHIIIALASLVTMSAVGQVRLDMPYIFDWPNGQTIDSNWGYYGESYIWYDTDGGIDFTQWDKTDDTKELSGTIFAGLYRGAGNYTGLSSGDSCFLIGGDITYYSGNDLFGREVGERIRTTHYNIVHLSLDGINYQDQSVKDGPFDYTNMKWKWVYKFDRFIVINGHIVDADNNDGYPRDLEIVAKGHIDTYKKWLKTGLHLKSVSSSPFPIPVVHKDEELYYDLDLMVNIFLEDFRNHVMDYDQVDWISYYRDRTEWDKMGIAFRAAGIHPLPKNNIHCVFEELEDGIIAKSYGKDADENIIIKVDPDAWLNATTPNKWYILYHELGHDVLNLSHGQGGRMMFNYPTKNYSWEDFFNDRDYMFLYVLQKLNPHDENDKSSLRWSDY